MCKLLNLLVLVSSSPGTHFTVLWFFNEIPHVKCLAQCRSPSTCSIMIAIHIVFRTMKCTVLSGALYQSPNRDIIPETKGIVLGGFVQCPDSHSNYSNIYPHQNAGEDRNWFQPESTISGAHTLNAAEASTPWAAVCRDGIAAGFHFPESTHPSKNLNASLIHNTMHKDFIFPAHSDTLWKQSVLPLKSLLSRKIWSFDIQEITVICKTRLICQV